MLNKTNSRTLIKAFGTETDFWLGKPIELWKVWTTNPKGESVQGTRLAPATAAGSVTPIVAPQASSGATTPGDGTGHPVQMGNASVAVPPAQPGHAEPDSDLDDKVPF